MRPTVNKMHSIKYIGGFSNPDQAGFEGLRGGAVPLTVGVDFAAQLLVHVSRVEWVKVSR